jgi:hypothetical protein
LASTEVSDLILLSSSTRLWPYFPLLINVWRFGIVNWLCCRVTTVNSGGFGFCHLISGLSLSFGAQINV